MSRVSVVPVPDGLPASVVWPQLPSLGNNGRSSSSGTRFSRKLADALPFIPDAQRTYFDSPLPTLVVHPKHNLAQEVVTPTAADVHTTSHVRRLAIRQLPMLHNGLLTGWQPAVCIEDERDVEQAVNRVANTAPSAAALTPSQYATHFFAILAAEAVHRRHDAPSHDILRLRVRVADNATGDFSSISGRGGEQFDDGYAKLRIGSTGDPLHLTLKVPGLADGAPLLGVGSRVRIRKCEAGVFSPWTQSPGSNSADQTWHPTTSVARTHPLEMEAQVVSTSVQNSTAVLRLPSTVRTRACLLCNAVGENTALTAPSVRLAPCGHTVLCMAHYRAFVVMTAMVTIGSVLDGASPFCRCLFCGEFGTATTDEQDTAPFDHFIVMWLTTGNLHLRFEAPLVHSLPILLRATDAAALAVDSVGDNGVMDPSSTFTPAFDFLLQRLFPPLGLPGVSVLHETMAQPSQEVACDPQLNPEQRAAVVAIVRGLHGRTPYLLLGPAGCGKTATLVESVLEILRRSAPALVGIAPASPMPSHSAHNEGAYDSVRSLRNVMKLPREATARVLIVAPSDEAADVVLRALLDRSRRSLNTMESAVQLRSTRATTAVTEDVVAPSRLLPRYRPTTVQLHDSLFRDVAVTATVLRFNLPTRRPESLAQELFQFSYADERTGAFVYPSMADLNASSVIVASTDGATSLARYVESTPASANELSRGLVWCFDGPPPTPWRNSGVPFVLAASRLQLSHLFFDEASQATEPEALVPVLLCSDVTRIVLCGDPRQLGPPIRSPIALARGLGVSLQERLLARQTVVRQRRRQHSHEGVVMAAMESAVVNSTHVDHDGVVRALDERGERPDSHHKLDRTHSAALGVNYRSHPLLLDLPNQLFYSDTLVSNASSDIYNIATGWSLLPRLRRKVRTATVPPLNAASTNPTTLPVLNAVNITGDDDNDDEGVAGSNRMTNDTIDRAIAPSTADASAITEDGYPMLCIGVRGIDKHELNTVSFWNTDEVEAVVWIIRTLLADLGVHAAPPPRRVYVQEADAELNVPSQDATASLRAARGGNGIASSTRPFMLEQRHIGVITAYRQQVISIRDALRYATVSRVLTGNREGRCSSPRLHCDRVPHAAIAPRHCRDVGLGGISVGMVENFQGEGKAVIIVSSVLSCNNGKSALEAAQAAAHAQRTGAPPPPPSLFSSIAPGGRATALGLFGDAKRFNVAITRAESLLIVVGDPDIWALDNQHWRPLLQNAVDHKAFIGCLGTQRRGRSTSPPMQPLPRPETLIPPVPPSPSVLW